MQYNWAIPLVYKFCPSLYRNFLSFLVTFSAPSGAGGGSKFLIRKKNLKKVLRFFSLLQTNNGNRPFTEAVAGK